MATTTGKGTISIDLSEGMREALETYAGGLTIPIEEIVGAILLLGTVDAVQRQRRQAQREAEQERKPYAVK
jgi:hypothetical protein